MADMVTMNGEMEDRDGIHMLPTIIHPYSRGTVRLTSADPLQPASVNPNFLHDQRDARILIDGMHKLVCY